MVSSLDDLERVEHVVEEAAEDAGAFALEYRIVRADGEVRWVLDRGHVARGTGGTWIDGALFESARLDGAGWWQEFRAITVPSLRNEVAVCLTVTIIAALAAFDIVYVSTGGGPGGATAVPGIQIYILAFLERQVGLASALAVVLVVLVLIVILPLQRLSRGDD